MAVSLLTACGTSIGSIEPPDFAEVPEDLADDCNRPIKLPDRPLREAEIVPLWAADRINLANCGDQLQQLVEWIEQRDAGIMND